MVSDLELFILNKEILLLCPYNGDSDVEQLQSLLCNSDIYFSDLWILTFEDFSVYWVWKHQTRSLGLSWEEDLSWANLPFEDSTKDVICAAMVIGEAKE